MSATSSTHGHTTMLRSRPQKPAHVSMKIELSPSTLNAQRSTLNAQRSTLNAQRSTLIAHRSSLIAQRSSLIAQRSTLNPEHACSPLWLSLALASPLMAQTVLPAPSAEVLQALTKPFVVVNGLVQSTAH
eukprot:gene7318-9883_t